MNWGDWIPAISTTSLLAASLWLLRSLISTRLRASVQHEFEQKIVREKGSVHEFRNSALCRITMRK